MSSKAALAAATSAARQRTTCKNLLIAFLCLACLALAFQLGKLYNDQAASTAVSAALSAVSQAAAAAASTPSGASVATAPYYAKGTTRFTGVLPVSKTSMCLNTCAQARNGVCDDGRNKPGEGAAANIIPRRVYCDLGTDCEDCGPWTPSGLVPWAAGTPGPVARLLADGVEVHARQSTTQPPFFLAHTDPAKDVDVSEHMMRSGMVEAGITTIVQKVLQDRCRPQGGSGRSGLFVDVGANFGWFSVLAAAMGCRVLAFEPVPTFHAFFEYSVHLNGLAHLVDMRGNVVSHVAGSTLKMVVPSQGIWGTAGIDGLNIDKAITKSVNKEIYVPSQRLDDLVREDVLLLKVDVEGWEWSVMQGAAGLVRGHAVDNIIMEYSPGVPERSFKTNEIKATVQMLINMVEADFRIAHIGDGTKHVSGLLTAPLPLMEEVSRHNLYYDLVDAELLARRSLGCPEVHELRNITMWASCGSLPEDASPRSLRSALGHNTNLWAARGASARLQNLKGRVGILPLDAPASQYFVNNDKDVVFGQGSRPCNHLPAEVSVRHRCPCPTGKAAMCEAEEAKVKQLAEQNKIPTNYVLSEDGKLVQGNGAVELLMKEIGSARAIGVPYLPGAVQHQATAAASLRRHKLLQA